MRGRLPVSAAEGGERPRILLATGAVYACPLRVALDLARAAGCDGVELDVSPECLLRRPSSIARLAAEAGQPIRAVHPPLFPLPGWPGGSDFLPRLADLALALGAPTIVVHPPRARQLGSPLVADFIARSHQVQERLRGTGAQVVLENPGFFRPADRRLVFWDLPALHRLAVECGVAMALDTTHAGSSPYPLLESYEIVAERLAHVHLSDLRDPPRWLDHPWLYSYVKHHQPPGSGRLPLTAFLQRLAADGFRGDITLELSPLSLRIWNPARSREVLAAAVQATRAAFDPSPTLSARPPYPHPAA